MPSDDRLWRDRLATLADRAAPPSFATDRLRARVRRRRNLLAAGTGAASIMVVSLVTVAAAGIVGGGDPITSTGATPGPSTPTGPTATTGSEPDVYVCGDRYDHPGSTPGGILTAEVSSVAKVNDDSGPAVTVTFAATRAVHVASSPPSLLQVLYLKGGVIVGGGPMVNQPGDTIGQGVDAIRSGFDLAPGKPHEQQLGPREMLCPSLTWSEIWATPDRYEVALVLGPIEDRGKELILGVPLPPTVASLVVKAPLPG
ncbi:hypothetical protein [Micromonospora parathelypteridis]|uniref:Uncharacterized protein n=1 Tax=Micromonospora parathelypteridis TaxID=1839617 RepID=A0A840VGF4_9ACTN|nr:hypothetical protein [Micromonospora parathelypteridis]MBB5475873.1 hypothetical protein [Micromonospora parathelypteridis]GGO31837.1 hypothetical protein GCM10011576_61300 [Micromonospora parathelypteridis]